LGQSALANALEVKLSISTISTCCITRISRRLLSV